MLPSGQEIIDAIPIIISLVIIEGLLSVDNALAIAALASKLPERQKYRALRYGIIGAYVFRGLALAFAAWIISNSWIRLVGAIYLLYLMCANLSKDEGDDAVGDKNLSASSFLLAIIQIEILDLSLSIDNVVAAVAMSPQLWVVCTGVFIGILALRFLAGYCIRLLEIYPILASTAFLLVGYVGVVLAAEEISNMAGHRISVHSTQKFVGIVAIVLASIAYSKAPSLQRLLRPVFQLAVSLMSVCAKLVEVLFSPLKWATERIAHRNTVLRDTDA